MLTPRMKLLSLMLLLSACACAASDEGDLGVVRAPVIAGTLDEGDPAVVALLEGPQQFYCTGALISPKVILTAAHCLEGATAENTMIFFGTDSTVEGGEILEVEAVKMHPGYYETDDDIGVVSLKTASAVPPVPLNTKPLAAEMAGQDVRVVGFGTAVDGDDDSGKKRTGLTTFNSLNQQYMMVTPKDGQSGCFGDSGGPNFMTFDGVEVLAGVTSYGTEDSCLAGMGGNTDVQQYLAWIQEFVAWAESPPSCDADDRCLTDCAAPDPDCACVADGACDDTCPNWQQDDPDCQGCGAGDGCWHDCPASAPDPDCPAETASDDGMPAVDHGDGGGCAIASVGAAPGPMLPGAALLLLGLAAFVIRRRWGGGTR